MIHAVIDTNVTWEDLTSRGLESNIDVPIMMNYEKDPLYGFVTCLCRYCILTVG